jgi:predicted DNA-binding transcriptional regulator AlpA
MSRPVVVLLPDLPDRLRQLADRLDTLAAGEVIGTLESIKFDIWTVQAAPVPSTPAPSRGLAVGVASERSGMSKDWLYREARAGRLPFARRLGRRVVFDEAGLTRWLDRRAGQRRG